MRNLGRREVSEPGEGEGSLRVRRSGREVSMPLNFVCAWPGEQPR